jgi:hypothetical protein
MSGVYKDSLFRSLFNNKAAFLSLYNAVSGKNYDEKLWLIRHGLGTSAFLAPCYARELGFLEIVFLPVFSFTKQPLKL